MVGLCFLPNLLFFLKTENNQCLFFFFFQCQLLVSLNGDICHIILMVVFFLFQTQFYYYIDIRVQVHTSVTVLVICADKIVVFPF